MCAKRTCAAYKSVYLFYNASLRERESNTSYKHAECNKDKKNTIFTAHTNLNFSINFACSCNIYVLRLFFIFYKAIQKKKKGGGHPRCTSDFTCICPAILGASARSCWYIWSDRSCCFSEWSLYSAHLRTCSNQEYPHQIAALATCKSRWNIHSHRCPS